MGAFLCSPRASRSLSWPEQQGQRPTWRTLAQLLPRLCCNHPLASALGHRSYMHSFSLAGKYFVLVDYPLRAKKPQSIADGFIEAFSWFEKEPTIVYVIDRESGQFWSFCTESFFSFHHINGFEKEGKVYIDLIAYPNADIIYKVSG